MKSSIVLQTRLGTDIENFQQKEIGNQDAKTGEELYRNYQSIVNWRTETLNPEYNCHGLTFASRRTKIYRSVDLITILKDDNYELIARISFETTAPNPDQDKILPGDVVIYYEKKESQNYISHSGIVVSSPTSIIIVADPSQGAVELPYVVSKWGTYREVIHRAHQCPYDISLLEFYRIL
ncbi:MAG: hypothetical protein IH859_07365 [Chloroflexi bacterium]|nr:hypothetical protein [Chloroflexota bacterium]